MRALLLATLIQLVRLSPRSFIQAYGRFLTAVLCLVARKDVRRIQSNIQLVYNLPPHSNFSKRFVKQVIAHQVMSALETLKASYDRGAVTIEGVASFNEAMKSNLGERKGVIVITGHMGSWEFVGMTSSEAAGGFHALAKPGKIASLTQMLEGMRERFGIKVLWSNKKSLVRDMLQVLQNGKALGFVMDQKPEGRVGPVVDFFGQPTEFVNGPAAVSLKTGCAAMAVFCMREGPWRYRLIYKTVTPPGHGFSDAQQLTQAMASEIERVIRLYPEQWAWNYRRWKVKTVDSQA